MRGVSTISGLVVQSLSRDELYFDNFRSLLMANAIRLDSEAAHGVIRFTIQLYGDDLDLTGRESDEYGASGCCAPLSTSNFINATDNVVALKPNNVIKVDFSARRKAA